MKRTKIKELLNSKEEQKEVLVKGWVRTRRDSKGGFSFIEINDGSCLAKQDPSLISIKENPPLESRRVLTQPLTKTSFCSSLLLSNSFIFVRFINWFPKTYRFQINPLLIDNKGDFRYFSLELYW